ncbi:MAG: hypothetical protein ACOY3P_17755 [Planctomycetota bacterium]
MPIEFRCTSCQKLLRTPDDTAGKHAKCPECGTVVVIPTPGAETQQGGFSSAGGAAEGGLGAGGRSMGGGGIGGGSPPPSAPGGSAAGPSPYAPGGVNPYQSPSTVQPQAAAGAPFAVGAGELTPTKIDLGDIFRTTWEIFKQQWGMALGTMFVAWILNMVVSYGLLFAVLLATGDVAAWNQTSPATVIAQMVANIFGLWIWIGVVRITLKLCRGQPTSVGEIFSGGPWFINVLVATFLFGLMIGVVSVVCMLPTLAISSVPVIVAGAVLAIVFAAFLFLFFFPYQFVIIDRNAGPIECFGVARRLTEGNLLTGLGILVLMILLGLAALIACCVGLIVYAPYLALMYAVIYLRISGQPTMVDAQMGYAQANYGSPFQPPA